MYALTREKVKGGDNGQVYNRQINGHISLPTNHYRLLPVIWMPVALSSDVFFKPERFTYVSF